MTRSHRDALLTAIAVGVVRLLTLPQGFWEGEEIRFANALLTFDPFHLHPEPPGYPLYVALGRIVNVFITNPFASLVTLSVVASIAGSWLVARFAGPAAALFLFLSPALLVFGPLPNSESVTLALIAAAFYSLHRGQQDLFAVYAAAAIGARPQIAVAMLVTFAVTRPRRRSLLLFAATLFICFVPLFEVVDPGWAARTYDAMHRASEATGATGKELGMRFIAHPWGSKFLALPLLLLAAVGAVRYPWRVDAKTVAPPLIFGIVHLLFAFFFLDHSDGVQPVLPALLPMAMLAGRVPFAPILAVLYAAGSIAYAWPVLQARRGPSPPMQAIRAIPPGQVVLYEPSLQAHAFSPNAHPIRDFGRFESVVVLADGGSSTPGAQTFSWPDSDAYGKITTERYRVVSLIPFPRERRYIARSGVYPFERTARGEEWRWLAKEAVLDIPRAGSAITLQLGLPPNAPANRVTVNGTAVDVPPGGSVAVTVPYAPVLTIRSERAFMAGRELAVQLLSLEQHSL